MKRGPFLGAAAAAVLSGCGGRGMGTIPGVGRPVQSQAARGRARMVPASADAIPANVLNSPIVGEARRFDGAVAPRGWLLASGQTLTVAQYPKLGAILDHAVAEGKKQTFALPAPGYGLLVACSGFAPSSPQALAASPRHPTLAASLGPGARRGPTRTLSAKAQAAETARAAQIRASRALFASALRPRTNVSGQMSADESSRIAASRATARVAALQALSPSNRTRVEALVEAIASGRTTTYAAQTELANALSAQEASALLEAHDAQRRASVAGWAGMEHPNPQPEASRYAIEITFTPEQRLRYALLPENQ
ncbi:MAG TPA: phage tail protein [Candidatus Baltobacteraceae bacterium]|nr:phage tail protein [Candidatus Baltobacteraceae bacterium]